MDCASRDSSPRNPTLITAPLSSTITTSSSSSTPPVASSPPVGLVLPSSGTNATETGGDSLPTPPLPGNQVCINCLMLVQPLNYSSSHSLLPLICLSISLWFQNPKPLFASSLSYTLTTCMYIPGWLIIFMFQLSCVCHCCRLTTCHVQPSLGGSSSSLDLS